MEWRHRKWLEAELTGLMNGDSAAGKVSSVGVHGERERL